MIYAAAFVIGWIVQFIGHAIKRAGPAFGSRPLNLLLGPVSMLNDFLPLVARHHGKSPNERLGTFAPRRLCYLPSCSSSHWQPGISRIFEQSVSKVAAPIIGT
jgi:hypothetical protein